MKKLIVILIIIASIVLVSCFAVFLKYNEVYDFCLEDYSEEQAMFSSYLEKYEYSFGEIRTAKEAKAVAQTVFDDIYRSSGYYLGTLKPYMVSYDETNQVWLVQGSTIFFIRGACVLIDQKQGTVLAVWNEKF